MTGLTFLADLTPAQAVCLGVSAAGVVALPALLFADATVADFDPRPAVSRLVESGRVDALLVVVGPAKRDACELASAVALDARLSLRHAAVTAAALAALLLPATEGAAR